MTESKMTTAAREFFNAISARADAGLRDHEARRRSSLFGGDVVEAMTKLSATLAEQEQVARVGGSLEERWDEDDVAKLALDIVQSQRCYLEALENERVKRLAYYDANGRLEGALWRLKDLELVGETEYYDLRKVLIVEDGSNWKPIRRTLDNLAALAWPEGGPAQVETIVGDMRAADKLQQQLDSLARRLYAPKPKPIGR